MKTTCWLSPDVIFWRLVIILISSFLLSYRTICHMEHWEIEKKNIRDQRSGIQAKKETAQTIKWLKNEGLRGKVWLKFKSGNESRFNTVEKKGNRGSNCLTATALKQLCKWLVFSRLTQSTWKDKQDPYTGFGLSHAHLHLIMAKLYLK